MRLNHPHARAQTPCRVSRRGAGLRKHPGLCRGASPKETWKAGTGPIGANSGCALPPLLAEEGWGAGSCGESVSGDTVPSRALPRKRGRRKTAAGLRESTRSVSAKLKLTLTGTSPAITPQEMANVMGRWSKIARRAVAGLAAAVLTGTAALAQAPHSVTILPDVPEPPSATRTPDFSMARLELLNSTIKVENPAGVSVDVIPKLEVPAGSKIGFRIAAKRAGYVILLDVDASGRLTQIFPNPTAATHGLRGATNLIKPGHSLTIPQPGTPYAGFEFVAEPPGGIAMVVALLSDRPVQVVDLPDTPPPAFAPGDTLKYVRDQARTLKVANPEGGRLEQPNWSIDGKFYLIR